MGRVYAVASAKGGVGKTTTTANLGVALASTNASVVVVDADLGLPNLGGALGVEADPTVHDALAGRADADAAVHEGVGGVDVAVGSRDIDDFRGADPAGLADLVEDLADGYDYVLVDGGAGLTHDSLVPLSIADGVVLVTGTGRDAQRDTAKTREVTDRLGTPVTGVVVERVADGTPPDLDGVDGLADLPVLGSIPESSAVAAGTEAGEPVVLSAPDDPAALAYRRTAAELVDDASLLVEDEVDDSETDDSDANEDDPEADDNGDESDEVDDSETDEDRDDPEADDSDANEDDDPEADDEGDVENDAEADGDAEHDAAALVDEAESEATDTDDALEAEGVQETALFSSGSDLVEEAEEPDEDSEQANEKKGFFSRLFGLE
jgi:septum site-determining protein MinD